MRERTRLKDRGHRKDQTGKGEPKHPLEHTEEREKYLPDPEDVHYQAQKNITPFNTALCRPHTQ